MQNLKKLQGEECSEHVHGSNKTKKQLPNRNMSPNIFICKNLNKTKKGEFLKPLHAELNKIILFKISYFQMEYWNRSILKIVQEPIEIGKAKQYLTLNSQCSIVRNATEVESLRTITKRHIHENACVTVISEDKKNIYKDFTPQEQLIKKLRLPTKIKIELLVEARVCKIHAKAIYERCIWQLNSNIYIEKESELYNLLKPYVSLDYLHRYHQRRWLFKKLREVFQEKDLKFYEETLFPMIRKNVRFSKRGI